MNPESWPIPQWIKIRWRNWLAVRLPRRTSLHLNQRTIFIFPTRQGFAVVFVAVLLFITGVNYENNVVLALCFLVVSLFLQSVLLTFRNMSGLGFRVGRTHPGFAGGHADYELLLSPGSRHRHALHIENGEQVVDVELSPDVEQTVSMHVYSDRRGLIYAPRIYLDSRAPLGWVRAWSYFLPDCRVLFYPQPIANEEQAFSGTGLDVSVVLRARGRDAEFQGIREYIPGDSLRHIYWKGVARTGQWLTKDYRAEPAGGSGLSESALHHLPKELRLSYLCWWVLQLAEQEMPFSLELDDATLPLGMGESHVQQALYLLAVSGASGAAHG